MGRFLICISVCYFFGIADSHSQTSEKDFYVVIGTFSRLEEAEALTDEANLKGFSAQYALHSKKKQYYVYLIQSSDQKKAKLFLDQIRKETQYKNAWLYKGKLGEEH